MVSSSQSLIRFTASPPFIYIILNICTPWQQSDLYLIGIRIRNKAPALADALFKSQQMIFLAQLNNILDRCLRTVRNNFCRKAFLQHG